MDDAFPVDHYLDLRFRNVEEPAGLDDFEPLVHEGGGIDRDFGAHLPIGVLERPFGCDVLQFLFRQGPEGSAGGREDQAADIFFPMAFQRLENRTMFAVDREDAHAMFARFLLHQLPRHDHRFFIGQGDLLAAPDGRQRGHEAGAADDRGDDQFGFWRRGDLTQALRSIQDFNGQSGATLPESGGSGGIREGHHAGFELADLLFELFVIAAGCQPCHAELSGEPVHDV